VSSEEKIKLKNSEGVSAQTDAFDINKTPRPCKLGLNLYAKDRKKSKLPAGAVKKHGYKSTGGGGGAATSPPAAVGVGAGAGAGVSVGVGVGEKKGFEASDASKAAATKQLNMLANLIGTVAAKDNEKLAVLNLFPDTSLTGDGGKGGATAHRTTEIITFDENDSAQLKAMLSKELEGGDAAPAAAGAAAGADDLLSLMDKASS